MKKIISIFLVISLVSNVWAYDFESNNLYYKINTGSTDRTVELVTNAHFSLFGWENTYYFIERLVIPEYVSYDGIEYTVTSIGNSAFRNCPLLMSVIMPNSITNIADYAFAECSTLTFVILSDSLKRIGNYAFANCYGITSDSVVSYFNPNANIPVPTGVELEEMTPQEKSFVIPTGVTTIGRGAFSYCSSLTSVVVPGSLVKVGRNVFKGCDNLKKIVVPPNMKKRLLQAGLKEYEGIVFE